MTERIQENTDMKRKLRIPLAAALLSAAAAGTSLAGVSIPVQTNISLQTEVTAVQAETAPVLTNESSGSQTAETTVTQAESPAPVQTGWVQENGQWKYYWDDGTMARSAWIQEGEDTWYFINDDGTMRTGWLQNGEDWYFFDSSGVMQTRAIRVEDRVYYMDYDGTLLVGSRSVNGIRYNFTENGCTGQMPYTSKMFHSDGTPFTEAERQNLSWNSPS